MFQYAAGRYLAEKHSTILKLDLSSFESSEQRKYSLHCFNIQENLATQDEINTLLKHPRNKAERLLEKVNRKIGGKSQVSKSLIQEKFFHFDPYILEVPNNSYLHGFWQSEKYFYKIRDILLNEFSIKYPQNNQNKALTEKIKLHDSVSLHIRRGDYIQNKTANQFHGICCLDYYKRCVNYIKEKLLILTFSSSRMILTGSKKI